MWGEGLLWLVVLRPIGVCEGGGKGFIAHLQIVVNVILSGTL